MSLFDMFLDKTSSVSLSVGLELETSPIQSQHNVQLICVLPYWLSL